MSVERKYSGKIAHKASALNLETPRLLLRQWSGADINEYAAICSNPEVMHYLTGKVFTRMEAWRHLAYLIGHWQLRGFGHWAVEEKSTGKLIGRLGFFEPEDYPGFEIGWTFARSAWGRGYAIEGARCALAHAFMDMDREHVISLIVPDNQPSIRVAERLGEQLEGALQVMGVDLLKYGISRERWLTSHAV